jgi:hypothetical protein
LDAFRATLDPSPVVALRARLRAELPPGQARVGFALLVDGPEFEPPEPPVTLAIISEAF